MNKTTLLLFFAVFAFTHVRAAVQIRSGKDYTIEFISTNTSSELVGVEKRIYDKVMPYGMTIYYSQNTEGFADYSLPYYFDHRRDPAPAWGDYSRMLKPGEQVMISVSMDAFLMGTAVQFDDNKEKLNQFVQLIKSGKLKIKIFLQLSSILNKDVIASEWMSVPSTGAWINKL
jgi:hypothetical protein